MKKRLNNLSWIILATFLLACFPAVASAAQWAMHRHDSQHTNSTSYSGPTNPIEKWVFQEQAVQGGVAIADDGTIYFISEDNTGILYALNPDGTVKHAYDLYSNGYGFGCCTRPVIGPDGTIYVSAKGIVAFTDDPVLGLVKKWYQPAYGSMCCGSLSLGPGGNLYVTERTVDVLDAQTGDWKWSFDEYSTSGEHVTYAPAVSHDGSNAYITTQYNLHIVSSLDGTIIYSQAIENPGTGSAVVAADGSIYVPDGRNILVLTERPAPKKGYTKRSISVGSSSETVFEIALTNDGSIACVTFETITYHTWAPDFARKATDGRLYFLSPDNSIRWSTNFLGIADPYSTQTPVPLIDADKNVYMATAEDDGTARVYGFDINGNTLIDEFYWDNNVGGGPVTVALDASGVLYASFFNGYTYAYEQAP